MSFRERYEQARRRMEESNMDDRQAWRALRHVLAQRLWRLRLVRLAAPWFRRRARRLLAAAQAGDPEAQYFYAQDRRKAGDIDAALICYSAAAEQGYTRAMVNAGKIWQDRANPRQAYDLYMQAAEADDPIGAFNAGVLADSFGHVATAQTYYQQARDLGHPHAALRLDPGFR
jgi:TPR repeat protein